MAMGKGLNPNSYKGPTLIDLAPEARFSNLLQVIVFWVVQFWFLDYVGDLFGIPVLRLMFDWLLDPIRSLWEF